ncbi:MAG: hypothetical protein ACR65R_16500 [Methylomicrobium sp.]
MLELLISMLIGLFILGVVVGLFVSMIKSDSDNIKAIQLNQELRSVMSLITRDLRRAGSNQNAAVSASGSPPSNSFAEGANRLTISANYQGDANSCITYAYDSASTFGTIQSSELYGFRLDSANNAVETRSNGAACNAAGWTDLTDSTLVNVSALTFSESNVSEGGITLRQIAITLSGSLVNDINVTRTITETVKLRNDWF